MPSTTTGIFANVTDIEAQLNHICNRAQDGVFSATGDTGQSADKRYSDDAITESRRKAAYKIFDALASNLSHPYWSYLSDEVELAHGDPIPPHYGEIGIPLISPYTGADFREGFPADGDEIESYRNDELGTFSDLYGSGTQAHNARTADNVLSPMALRYSTDNGVIKFTGAACKLMMVKIPNTDEGDDINTSDMADTMMPVTLSALNVKLALGLLIKEGDNLFRVAAWLAQEGEKELINIKMGAIHAQPIDPQKVIAMAQRMS